MVLETSVAWCGDIPHKLLRGSFWWFMGVVHMEGTKILPWKKEYERCVLCGKITDVRKDTEIQDRPTFIAGVGQLCMECCYEIYHTVDVRE